MLHIPQCIYFVFVFSLIGSQLPELQGMWGTIFAVASRVCAAGAYYACLQFASELFPTEIRGKGSSAFEISGGLGLFIQPQINYLVRVYTPPKPSEISEKIGAHGIFDIPFTIQSHAESMKKNPGSPLGSTS